MQNGEGQVPGPQESRDESASGDDRDDANEQTPEAAGDDSAQRPGRSAREDTETQREPGQEQRRGRRQRDSGDRPSEAQEEVPGAHLEPDLVLEPAQQEDEYDTGEYGRYIEDELEATEEEQAPEAQQQQPAAEPLTRQPIDLAADARYHATGKRKTSVARVILRPGSGEWTVNGRPMEEFLPRRTLQRSVRQPLEQAGYESRMDVAARVHGGGVSSQAGALRHGIARALVEADPALRIELKRRGFLRRDSRAKERRKAGLKKARKRPQFSKR